MLQKTIKNAKDLDYCVTEGLLENENKFLIIDTPQDGGVRMNNEALSYEVLVERLLLDNRIPDDSMRCILLKKAAEADWMIDNNIMNSGLCNELN